MTDAIILAGGDSNQEFLKKFGVNNRSLLVIHNKFMIEYVIEALKEVSSIKLNRCCWTRQRAEIPDR